MQTTIPSAAPLSQAQFLAWCEALEDPPSGRHELVDGRVVVSPPSFPRQCGVEARILYLLSRHLEERSLEDRPLGGRVFGTSLGVELPTGDTLQPDVTYFSRRSLEASPEHSPDRFLRAVPDLVVEVLSTSTAQRDRTRKRDIYERSGVAEYWLVDTWRRELTVLHREGGGFGPPRTLARGRVPCRVLPDLGMRVQDLFVEA